MSGYDRKFLLELYERMLLIREFEDTVKFLFLEGTMPGTIHQCQGQEATAVGVCAALAADELELHYQPVVRTADHMVVGFEALMRWEHPERGAVSPRDGRRGDLVVEVRLMLPRMLDERSKELLREFGRINGENVREPR